MLWRVRILWKSISQHGSGSNSSAKNLSEHFHSGSQKCDFAETEELLNPVGQGLFHLLAVSAPEIELPLSELKELRSSIAHGYASINEIQAKIKRVAPDLEIVLSVGILTLLAGAPETSLTWSATVSRDFSSHPDAVIEIRMLHSLPDHSPFLGEWIEVVWTFRDEQSSCDPDSGLYRYGHGVAVDGEIASAEFPVAAQRYIAFRQEGNDFTSPP